MARVIGSSSRNNCNRFGAISTFDCVTPVTLPPGRLRLVTRPRVAFLSAGRVLCYWFQDSDTTQVLTLLCARCKRPRRCRAVYHPDEVSPPHCRPRGLGQSIVAIGSATLKGAGGCPLWVIS